MKLLLQVSVWFCALLAASRAEDDDEGSFRRFHDTTSPDGAYCFAWGDAAEKGVKLSTRKEWPRDKAVEVSDVDFEDYLVDAVHGRLLMVIPGLDFYSNGPGRRNHRDLMIAWSTDSKTALAVYGGRFAYEDVVLIDAPRRRVVSVAKKMDAAYHAFVRAQGHKIGERLVYFTMPAFSSPVKFTVNAWAAVMKEETEFESELQFQIVGQGEKSFSITFVKGRSLKVEENGAKEQLDADLNRAYRAARARLSETARDALTKEQRRWLQERDGLGDDMDFEKDQMTRKRIYELQTRAENW